MDTDDSALIEKCRAGDIAAFEPLVEKYRQRVWRLAYNVLRDREEAWDVAQEAFIKAYQALPSFRGQSAFYTWLYRITMNVAADRARSRARPADTERRDRADRKTAREGDCDARPDYRRAVSPAASPLAGVTRRSRHSARGSREPADPQSDRAAARRRVVHPSGCLGPPARARNRPARRSKAGKTLSKPLYGESGGF